MNSLHRYNTRFQKNIQEDSVITIPEGSHYADIQDLLKNINNENRGIKYYPKPTTNQTLEVFIKQFYDDDEPRIEIKGRLQDLFAFLSKEHNFTLLLNIWNDNIPEIDDEEPPKRLDIQTYNRVIKQSKGIIHQCPICMEMSTKKQLMATTQCGHIFHNKCLKKWLTKECTAPTCPMCRHDLCT